MSYRVNALLLRGELFRFFLFFLQIPGEVNPQCAIIKKSNKMRLNMNDKELKEIAQKLAEEHLAAMSLSINRNHLNNFYLL